MNDAATPIDWDRLIGAAAAPKWADAWAAERGKPSDTTTHELYAILVLATAVIGGLVFFGCAHWHDSWSTLSLAQIALKGSEPLAAQYPWLSAVIAALMTVFIGRVLIFFHRLESK